jgi:hypothetical protein
MLVGMRMSFPAIFMLSPFNFFFALELTGPPVTRNIYDERPESSPSSTQPGKRLRGNALAMRHYLRLVA